MERSEQWREDERMVHASGALANASGWRPIEPIPLNEHEGVTQDEYDPLTLALLGKFWNDKGPQHEMLIFPAEGECDAVPITSNDMESLQPGEFLSGNIIDFYIKYLQKSRSPFHSFNNFFFTKLVGNDGVSRESEQRKAAFDRVKTWTGEVNIFEKAYIFIPVNQSSHWSLIIICHLSSLTSSPDKLKGPPSILHLDSVEGKHTNLEDHIRSYIIHAWTERWHDPTKGQLMNLSQMKYREVKVPQQGNHYDCGIYLLHFVELFIFQPLVGNFVPNQGSLFTSLWDASEVSAKRTKIRNVILERILVSRRKSQEREIQLSRLSRIQSLPVPQISVKEFASHLDGNDGRIEPQNNDLKQSNPGADEGKDADHHTTGEVGLDNQQHIGIAHSGLQSTEDVALVNQHHTEIVRLGHQATGEVVLDDRQGEELACATLKPGKERSKRFRNWSNHETSILLDCKKEGGRFFKANQATTDWNAISQEIENKLGTNSRSGRQCRLRYDTLLKAYKTSNMYCLENGKKFSELCQGELKLATNLTDEWYNTLDEINCRHLPQKAGSSKRMKYTPSADDSGPAPVRSLSPEGTQLPAPYRPTTSQGFNKVAQPASNQAPIDPTNGPHMLQNWHAELTSYDLDEGMVELIYFSDFRGAFRRGDCEPISSHRGNVAQSPRPRELLRLREQGRAAIDPTKGPYMMRNLQVFLSDDEEDEDEDEDGDGDGDEGEVVDIPGFPGALRRGGCDPIDFQSVPQEEEDEDELIDFQSPLVAPKRGACEQIDFLNVVELDEEEEEELIDFQSKLGAPKRGAYELINFQSPLVAPRRAACKPIDFQSAPGAAQRGACLSFFKILCEILKFLGMLKNLVVDKAQAHLKTEGRRKTPIPGGINIHEESVCSTRNISYDEGTPALS